MSLPPSKLPGSFSATVSFRKNRLHLQCLPSPILTSSMIISSGRATAGGGCGYGQWQRPCQRPIQRKLLVHVTVGRCAGAVRVVMSLEDTVADLVAATVEAYTKEMRRPLLREKDPQRYRLHYSSFCLESIDPNENVMKLGSRNFFLCTNTTSSSINPNCYENATMRSNSHSFSIANLIDFLMALNSVFHH